MNIPNKAIEAAAVASTRVVILGTPSDAQLIRTGMRAVEHAAPFIAAQALRDAADAYAEVFGRYHSGASWLRSRAYELEVLS